MDTELYTAFRWTRRLATGPLPAVLTAAYPFRDSAPPPLVFDHRTGQQHDFDWRGSLEDVLARALPSPAKAGPGRPKLGVVSTEVTLLPRHWEWLNAQPARASGTLRRLVETAMAQEASQPKKRIEALGKILWAVAGNEPQFEEASRALYAGDRMRLKLLTEGWSGNLAEFVAEWT